MNFAYTIVYVSDVAATLDFFERAFGLVRRFMVETGEYGELETGATTLSFAVHATARGNLGHDYGGTGRRHPAEGAGHQTLGPDRGLRALPRRHARRAVHGDGLKRQHDE